MAVREGWRGRFYEDFEVGDVEVLSFRRAFYVHRQGAVENLFPQAATPLTVD